MNGFSHPAIQQIPTTADTVYAFRITGRVDDDASETLAQYMNDVFDAAPGKVNMLLELPALTGSDWDNLLDKEVITSRFRSLSHVERYAAVGAPDRAAQMIGWMDKIIPVEARAFDASAIEDAWRFVGAHPQN